MKLYQNRQSISDVSAMLRKAGKTIGFVPTMGALHHGHIALLQKARAECDQVLVSIFVNPTQFNNPADYTHYPRMQENDLRLLEDNRCDMVFMPDEHEMYPEGPSAAYDLGGLDAVMEGMFRPGHFQGVADVVYRFFTTIKPDVAYFGLKDYQQFCIIRYLNEHYQLNVQVRGCETVREADGLAMSSRNLRLDPEARRQAPAIYETLLAAREGWKNGKAPETIKNEALQRLSGFSRLRPEYFEIVSRDTLKPVSGNTGKEMPVACTAVFAGSIRLIDNLYL